MRRSLSHYWAINLAVVAGIAVTTAVLTGALMVGDSIRGSLSQLTLERLGTIDAALVSDRFFDTGLAERLVRQPPLAGGDVSVAAVILMRGSAVHAASQRRASGVQIIGADGRFGDLYPTDDPSARLDFATGPGQIFPSVLLNEPLARELGARPGEDVLISIGRPSEVPTASLLGRRDPSKLATTLRLTVKEILPASGMGRFSLEARQTRPMIAYLDLGVVQRRLDRDRQANALLTSGLEAAVATANAETDVDRLLRSSLELTDLGLRLRRAATYLEIDSRELVLRPDVVRVVAELAADLGATASPLLTYLANQMQVVDRVVPYSTVTALRTPVPPELGRLDTLAGGPLERIEDEQVVLNRWAADDLRAEAGDRLLMTYYLVGNNDRLELASTEFEVASVVEQAGLAADPSLTPTVPGISEAEDIADWDPPFPVELDWIRPQDEAYWDEFGGTPKAFVNLDTGQRLWRNRYGQVTSMRLFPETREDLLRLQSTLERRLPLELSLEGAGFRWLAVREQGLRAASGSTDFAGLFLGFSLFLIAAALLLATLLISLQIQQRAREIGLRLAVGFPVRRVRRQLLTEGGLLAALGSFAGSGLAVLYARLMLTGLEAWWLPVVDAPFLVLHVRLLTLMLGVLLTVSLILLVIARSVRRASRVPIRRLLSGAAETGPEVTTHRRPLRLALLAAGSAALLLLAVAAVGPDAAPALFFAVGAALLVMGLSLFAAWCRRPGQPQTGIEHWTRMRMAVRNSARNPARSLLSISLVACASFVLVSVTASRKVPGADALSLFSGTGGLSLVAETAIPLPAPLAEISRAPRATSFFSFRLRPGDDASCLNLYRPDEPRVLGVPSAFIARGGFTFRETLGDPENPWTLLEATLDDGSIPAVGDYNSVRWILHSGLGKHLVLEDDHGDAQRLKIVGLLDTSIFQSELLISEESFLKHFPRQAGYGFVLGELPAEKVDATAEMLELELSAFGLDATSTVDRLASYQAVENMYLATFSVLGGLGLLLGTLGLGVVLLRNVLERRHELATLRAFGYRRSALAWMVVAENVVLLSTGLVIGSTAGLLAVAPHLLAGSMGTPWGSLAAILAAVFSVGLLASLGAVHGSLKIPLLPALKAD